MSIFFKPNGNLNVSTDPSDLPQAISGNVIASGEMTRCKNLKLDKMGVAETRDGSSKVNAVAIGQTSINRIIEQGGTRYTFSGTVIYEDEVSIATGLTDAAWTGILYNSYNSTEQNVFALNGTDRKRIEGSNVYEWGIAAPTVKATLAAGASTGLTGAYTVKYTYCRKESSTVVSESDPSPVSSSQTLTNGSLSVTWTASSDSQVTHVRVYRTAAGGALWYHDTDVAIGTLTLDTTVADGSLGTEIATNHDRPPLGSFVAGPNYEGYCFIVKDNLLYYCLPKQPEYWPLTYYVEVSPPQFPGQCLVFYNGAPYYLTKNDIYYVQGTGHETFFPLKMEAITGTQSKDGAVAVKGFGIFHIGTDGIYLYSEYDRNITESAFQPVFRGTTTNGIPGVGSLSTSWLIQFKNKLYFGYAGADDDYPTNVIRYNLDTQRTEYFTYGRELRTVTVDLENKRLLAGDTSGYTWNLEDTDETDDGGTVITWAIESKTFTLQTRAHFPRWVKYDVDASSATTATGALFLDGVSHQTHTLSADRSTKRRLVDTGNGERCSLRVSGTGIVAVHAVESE